MSSFLSNKFLQYRGQAAAQINIDHDLFCTTCGYNVRGLHYGRNCPECGQVIRRTGATADVLLSGSLDDRSRMRYGLLLMSSVLITLSLARLLEFVAIAFAGWPPAESVYLWIVAMMGLLWAVGVWLITARRIDAQYFNLRALRRAARLSQLIWIPATALWLIASIIATAGGSPDRTYAISLMLRIVASIGVVLVGLWLLRLANDAELEDSSRRINLSLWMLPVPSLILISLPTQMAWIGMGLLIGVVLTWCWFILLFGRAVLAMERHVAWGLRIASDAPLREARVHQTRTELQRDVEAQIRAVPRTSDADIRIEE